MKYSPELIQQTKKVFEPRMGKPMTDDEAKECIWRAAEFLKILARHAHKIEATKFKGDIKKDLN